MAVEQGSLVDRLRTQHAQAREAEKSLDLPIPGWSGMLRVKYAPVEWEKLAELLERASAKTPAEGLAENLEALGDACAAILVCEKGETRSLADALREQGEDVHGEVKFDQVAVEVLDLKFTDPGSGIPRPPETRDETILAAFAGAVSPELAITEHAGKLAAWMMGRNVEASEETLGKG